MQQEIKEIIKKHLPEEAGELIKELVDNHTELKRRYDNLETKHETLVKKSNQQEKALQNIINIEDREVSVKKRELDVKTREYEVSIKELDYQLSAEKDKTAFCKEVALGLVRNTEYREEIYKNKQTPVQGQYGIEHHNDTENITIEKEKK